MNIADNDSLASRIAVDINADLAILMSDVDGIYDRPPKEEGANFLTYFNPKHISTLKFGEKSNVGTGGMESKVRSASYALDHGCSVIICNGMKYNTIRSIMAGNAIGTMFTPLDVAGKTQKSSFFSLECLFYLPSKTINQQSNIQTSAKCQ